MSLLLIFVHVIFRLLFGWKFVSRLFMSHTGKLLKQTLKTDKKKMQKFAEVKRSYFKNVDRSIVSCYLLLLKNIIMFLKSSKRHGLLKDINY